MNYLVLLILHDVARLNEVLSAWEKAGVSGVTIVPTAGLGRIRNRFPLRDDLPLIPSLDDLLSAPHEELSNRTIFSIVESEELADGLIHATEQVLGDMMAPHTGIIAVLPLARVHGLNYNWKKGADENSGR
jgi:hypothetical protein